MKLLFDQNLPRRLVTEFSDACPGSSHVALLELATATDNEIFDYARVNGFTVVSKDSDFRQLCFYYGAPPKVVWERIGNATAGQLASFLRRNLDRILTFEFAEETFLAIEADSE